MIIIFPRLLLRGIHFSEVKSTESLSSNPGSFLCLNWLLKSHKFIGLSPVTNYFTHQKHDIKYGCALHLAVCKLWDLILLLVWPSWRASTVRQSTGTVRPEVTGWELGGSSVISASVVRSRIRTVALLCGRCEWRPWFVRMWRQCRNRRELVKDFFLGWEFAPLPEPRLPRALFWLILSEFN